MRRVRKMNHAARSTPGPELTDEDLADAMRHLPSHLEIGAEDFRVLYRLAISHALERLVGGLRAEDLMRPATSPLRTEFSLRKAAGAMVVEASKSLPVVDADRRVVGMLSESDVLKRLGFTSGLEVLLQPTRGKAEFAQILQDRRVGDAMTPAPISVTVDADFAAIAVAFRSHRGRSMPVVDADGCLLGMMARKAFSAVCPLGLWT